jgi:Cytosine deaminase and related metal-dependent hydrolases
MATDNAYAAFGLDLGLREGALADMALIDLKKPWFCPLTEENIVSHLVYSAQGGVETTIVGGRVLMRDGCHPRRGGDPGPGPGTVPEPGVEINRKPFQDIVSEANGSITIDYDFLQIRTDHRMEKVLHLDLVSGR